MHPSDDEGLHNPAAEIPLLLDLRKGGEVGDQASALVAAAVADQGPVVFPHRCGVVVANLLASTNWLDRHQIRVVSDAGVGIARVVGIHARGFQIDVAVRTDLKGIGLVDALAQHCGEIDQSPPEAEDGFARLEIGCGKQPLAERAWTNQDRRVENQLI